MKKLFPIVAFFLLSYSNAEDNGPLQGRPHSGRTHSSGTNVQGEIERAQQNQDEAFRQFSKTLKKDPQAAYRLLDSAEAEVDRAYLRSIKEQKQVAGEAASSSPRLGSTLKVNATHEKSSQSNAPAIRPINRDSDTALSGENIPKRIEYPSKKGKTQPELNIK